MNTFFRITNNRKIDCKKNGGIKKSEDRMEEEWNNPKKSCA